MTNYKKVWCPDRGHRLRVHRYVVAHFLGRDLSAVEVVHHIDGNKHHNALDNLALLPGQAEHSSLEQVLRRARRGQRPLFAWLIHPFEPAVPGHKAGVQIYKKGLGDPVEDAQREEDENDVSSEQQDQDYLEYEEEPF